MRLALFLLVFSILYGCMPNQCLSANAAAEINVVNLSRLEPGMNQVQVLKIMRHPYSDQVFALDTDTYDVWFYVTSPVVLGQSRMMPANLTPLVFNHGILIGWGAGYYALLKQRQAEMAKAKRSSQQMNQKEEIELENEKFEKVLEKSFQKQPPTQGTAPSTAPQITPQSPVKSNPQQQKKGSSQKGQPSLQPSQETPNWSPIGPQTSTPSAQSQSGAAGTASATGAQKKGQGQTGPQPQTSPNWSPVGPQSQPKNGQTGVGGRTGATGTQKGQAQTGPQQSPNWAPIGPQSQPQTGQTAAGGRTGATGTQKGQAQTGPQQSPNWAPIGPQGQPQTGQTSAGGKTGATGTQKGQAQTGPQQSPNWAPIGPQGQPLQPQGGEEQQNSQTDKVPLESDGPKWSPFEKQQKVVSTQKEQGLLLEELSSIKGERLPDSDLKIREPVQVSMSSPKPKDQEESYPKKDPKQMEKNKVPLTEEDDEMLQEERDQDFNQT